MLRAALIGSGRIARQHLACLRQRPEVNLTAVCDLSPVTAEFAAERYGVSRWFTDHRRMLREIRPDVVHVTTPPQSHFDLAMDALDAGAHVIVEKPAAVVYEDVVKLIERAQKVRRVLVENYNYVFSRPVRQLLELLRSGQAGAVHHVDVAMCLAIDTPGGAFVDPNVPHPALSLPAGAISDFLPHLASLAHAFVGPHRSLSAHWDKVDYATPLPYDEFRALVAARDGTASLSFSSHTQPDGFSVRVYADRLKATIGLFEQSLAVERVRDLPKPLVPVLNGLHQGREASRAAVAGLWAKLGGGPGTYEGLWELLAQTYQALGSGGQVPVSLDQVAEVNRLVDDLVDERNRL
ncbi:MAG: Gfo/Idh/MocA family protein [Acidimicrobiales bacterium]